MLLQAGPGQADRRRVSPAEPGSASCAGRKCPVPCATSGEAAAAGHSQK